MFRQTEPLVRYHTRKRKNIESTPPITEFFATVKRDRSRIEINKNVSQDLDESLYETSIPKNTDKESDPVYSVDDLRSLFKVPSKPSLFAVPDERSPVGLENLPKNVYSHIFTILDLRTVSAISLASTTMSSRVKCYVATHDFYRRVQLDHLDFLNESFRPEDEEFAENDPFIACGALIKAITITQNTETRAKVFLNICRNLRNQLGGSLQGFGRLLETLTNNWKFTERRIMIKAALRIDDGLRQSITKVLTAQPGQLVGLEMKVRSGLTQLFLTQNCDDCDQRTLPKEVVDFGAWLSVLIRNFREEYQGKLYYILFGPVRSTKTGESVDWSYFCGEKTNKLLVSKTSTNKQEFMKTLLSGIRALRVTNNSENSDNYWNGRQIYQLYLRMIEACQEKGPWSEDTFSMSLSHDSSGLFSEYLVSSFDPRSENYQEKMNEAAKMVSYVRKHLYHRSLYPPTFLAEALHHAFDHLAQLDGRYDTNYRSFLDKIWECQNELLTNMLNTSKNTTESCEEIREELQGQKSMAELLCRFSNTASLHQHALPFPQDLADRRINDPLEEDEQLDDI